MCQTRLWTLQKQRTLQRRTRAHVWEAAHAHMSCGAPVGHIRDRVLLKWVSRCHEGDLLARCSLRRLEPAEGSVSGLARLSSFAPLPRGRTALKLRPRRGSSAAAASVCHGRSASASRGAASAGSTIRRRSRLELQYFLFQPEWIPLLQRGYRRRELNSSLIEAHK